MRAREIDRIEMDENYIREPEENATKGGTKGNNDMQMK